MVFKSSFNAFDKTSLETLLKECLGVERVYLCGLVTSACVLSTALGAFSCGIEPVIVEDCVADRTRERHEAALALWDHYVFRVCCSWKDVFAAEAPMARFPDPLPAVPTTPASPTTRRSRFCARPWSLGDVCRGWRAEARLRRGADLAVVNVGRPSGA